jgi:hypothetical protein
MVNIQGDSPDAVALQLLMGIAMHEQKTLHSGFIVAEKEWVLNTLREIYVKGAKLLARRHRTLRTSTITWLTATKISA